MQMHLIRIPDNFKLFDLYQTVGFLKLNIVIIKHLNIYFLIYYLKTQNYKSEGTW